MKKKDHTTLSSYAISISLHLFLLLLFILIPLGNFAKPVAKSADYYPVDLVIRVIEKGESVPTPDIMEIKIKEETENIPAKDVTKIIPKEIKESKVIIKTKEEKETTSPVPKVEKSSDEISKDLLEKTPVEGKIPTFVGVISLPSPHYTKTAQNLEIEGKVEITFRTDEGGRFEKLDAVSVEIFEVAGQEGKAKEEIKQITVKTARMGQYGPMQGITIVCLFEKVGERFEARCNEKK